MKLWIASAFFTCTVTMADVHIDYSGPISVGDPIVFIRDRIVPDDYVKLEAGLRNRMRNRGIGLFRIAYLDSAGGDVETAIKISDLLKKYYYEAVVRKTAKCLSSCAIILGSSANRSIQPGGVVGVHRIYSDGGTESAARTAKDFEKLGNIVRSRFQDVGVSPDLWDVMLKTPPEDIRVLSEQEISKYGLRGSSAAYQDVEDSSFAEYLGINKEELYRRKAMASDCKIASGYRVVSFQDSINEIEKNMRIGDLCDSKSGISRSR